MLTAESQVTPMFTRSGCSVTAGQWTSPYDDRTATSATELEVDHLVPVAEAWESGAHGWTQEQRAAFYNDLGHADALNAVPRALNQDKGALGPEQWLPPAGVCRYVRAWTTIKIRSSLSVDPAERAALISHADACPASTVTVETVDVPRPPVTPPVGDPPQITVSSRTIDHGRTTQLAVVGTPGAVVDLYARSRRAAAGIIRTATLDAGRAGWTLQPGETAPIVVRIVVANRRGHDLVVACPQREQGMGRHSGTCQVGHTVEAEVASPCSSPASVTACTRAGSVAAARPIGAGPAHP